MTWRWLVLLALAGCSRDPVLVAQDATAAVVVPAVVAVREAVEPLAPPPTPPTISPMECPAAVDLIIRFEVISFAYYDRHLQGVICPPAASGPTWGIGTDGGHQTRRQILGDWHMHPDVTRLAETSGVVGQAACRPFVASRLHDVRTPLSMARPVFIASTLPRYDAMAARLYADGWTALTPCARGSLRSLTYNRGAGTTGESRREIRHIRDECVPVAKADPAQAARCIARELRAMTRVWVGTSIEAGMRNRRYGEADVAILEL